MRHTQELRELIEEMRVRLRRDMPWDDRDFGYQLDEEARLILRLEATANTLEETIAAKEIGL